MKPKKAKLYLIETERAFKVRESCETRWNNAWISCQHGTLDFKSNSARGVSRYLIGEIRDLGVDVTTQRNWVPSVGGRTQHHAGTGYQGALKFDSPSAAVQFLKQFFTVVNCG